MELFYQYPFDDSLYEAEELEVLKTLQANVIHEIMYHFAVIKQDISREELEAMSRKSIRNHARCSDAGFGHRTDKIYNKFCRWTYNNARQCT